MSFRRAGVVLTPQRLHDLRPTSERVQKEYFTVVAK